MILSGKKISEKLYTTDIKLRIEKLATRNVIPGLATILVGENPASQVYIRNKQKICKRLGIHGVHYDFPIDATELQLLDMIEQLSDDPNIHGILLQTPLPPQIDQRNVLEAIVPHKDVDGFHPYNLGRLSIGVPQFASCTPLGCMKLIESLNLWELQGYHAVVIGQSNIVGKPMVMELINAGATVTSCNRHTQNLKSITKTADVLIVAAGVPGLITKDMVKEKVIVIDVGITQLEDGTLSGDVARDVEEVALYITPVPGGVGPMTICMLMHNTVLSAEKRYQKIITDVFHKASIEGID